jgi:hypothetical protein
MNDETADDIFERARRALDSGAVEAYWGPAIKEFLSLPGPTPKMKFGRDRKTKRALRELDRAEKFKKERGVG